ncbi:glycosyltransferase family 4 protein [Novosphingobium tardum]|uniref:Glycosyltransferase family 4 protein n=1 Tax=Novosphingobium tardum TaxID=1538021 RepID=A0ABV8RLB5_9SPHN
MRIAYVINSLEGGGAAFPVPDITRAMRDAGAEVRILALTRRDGRALAAMERAGLTVRVREGGERDHLAAARWIDREAREWGATHLWTSLTRATLLGLAVGKLRGLPVASWQHNAFLKPANRRLLRAMQPLAALWVGDSAAVTELTARRLAVPRDRLACWPIFAARPDAPAARPWRPGELLRLGSLGRLHPAKGYDVLIEALAILHAQGFTPPVPFEVAIAGEGAERAALEAQARAAGIANLAFTGFAGDPLAFLAGLHLYLQPSRVEGLCIAAHQAMQAGLPVLGTATGEMPHTIVSGRSGEIVPPGDAPALADALARLLGRPENLAEMGAASRERVLGRFGPEVFAATGAALVERLGKAA